MREKGGGQSRGRGWGSPGHHTRMITGVGALEGNVGKVGEHMGVVEGHHCQKGERESWQGWGPTWPYMLGLCCCKLVSVQ